MTSDLIASWENGRLHWYWYEDVIVELINNYKKEKEWYKVVSFIANDLWINDFESYDIFAEKAPRNVINRFWWQAKPPKSDLHIVFKKWNIVIKKWISIKSSNWMAWVVYLLVCLLWWWRFLTFIVIIMYLYFFFF